MARHLLFLHFFFLLLLCFTTLTIPCKEDLPSINSIKEKYKNKLRLNERGSTIHSITTPQLRFWFFIVFTISCDDDQDQDQVNDDNTEIPIIPTLEKSSIADAQLSLVQLMGFADGEQFDPNVDIVDTLLPKLSPEEEILRHNFALQATMMVINS